MVSLTGRAVRSKGMVASSGWAGEKHASGWFPKHLPAAQVGGVRTATESGEHSAASYVTPHRSWSGDLSPQEGEHACQEANTYAPVLLSSGSRHVHASSTPFSCGSSRTAKSTRPVSPPCYLATLTDAACEHKLKAPLLAPDAQTLRKGMCCRYTRAKFPRSRCRWPPGTRGAQVPLCTLLATREIWGSHCTQTRLRACSRRMAIMHSSYARLTALSGGPALFDLHFLAFPCGVALDHLIAAAQLSSNNERASRFPVSPIKRPSFLVDKHTGGVGGILCMQQPSSRRDAHPSVANTENELEQKVSDDVQCSICVHTCAVGAGGHN